MATWMYDKDNVEKMEFKLLPVGDYKIRVANVEELVSPTSGNEYIKFTFDISGKNSHLWYNLTFVDVKPGRTNGFILAIADSFGVTPGDFSLISWKGKIGAAHVKHKDGYANISYFIPRFKQESLGNWVEAGSSSVVQDAPIPVVQDAHIPF